MSRRYWSRNWRYGVFVLMCVLLAINWPSTAQFGAIQDVSQILANEAELENEQSLARYADSEPDVSKPAQVLHRVRGRVFPWETIRVVTLEDGSTVSLVVPRVPKRGCTCTP